MEKPLILVALLLALGCNNPPDKAELTNESQPKPVALHTSCDSLDLVIKERDSTISWLESHQKHATTPKKNVASNELSIFCSSLVDNLINSFNENKKEEFLSHFSDQYSVSWIDVRDQARIERYTHQDFKKEFNRIIKEHKRSQFSASEVEILSSNTKGDLFNATIKFKLKEEQKADTHNSEVTMSIVGRLHDAYRIANLEMCIF